MKTSEGFLENRIDSPSVSRPTNHFLLSLIPYEETTTYKKGTRYGPEAIIEASGHMELLDETLRVDASTYGIETVRPEVNDLESITRHASRMRSEHPDSVLGFLGGEHSITPAILAGLGLQDVGIVWIDAHADLRTSYGGRDDNHACAGYNSLAFGRLVQIGVRSLAKEEVDCLDLSGRVKCFRDWGDPAKHAIGELPEATYLSIDLDGLSPTLMRAVGTPEPGGLSWEEVVDIIDFVTGAKDVRAFDVVELCPDERDVVSSFTAARLVHKVMAYCAHHKLKARS